jgi:hypothetical protein
MTWPVPNKYYLFILPNATVSSFLVLGLILVPNGKYLGRLLGDQYPSNNLVDESLDEPNGPGGRMLDLSYANDDINGIGDDNSPGLGLAANSTRLDYR